MVSAVIAVQDPLGQLPPAAGTFAPDVDGLFYFCVWVSLFFFALILGLLVYSAFKWKRKTEDQPAAANTTHNTALEVVWTLIPTVILMVIFAWGWKGNLDQSVAPGDALQYSVVGSKWQWTFFHPGDETLPIVNEVWVPVDTNVKFITRSADVLHSLYFPAMRAKRDVLPGRYQMLWFRATETGDFPIYCTEYCGDMHSQMRAVLHVVSAEEYATRPWDTMPTDPVARGEKFTMPCKACHDYSPARNRLVGPPMWGIWGTEEKLADGTTVIVDEEYVRNSIRNPNAQIVEGYPAAMTPYPESMLPDSHIDDIIAYLKTLK